MYLSIRMYLYSAYDVLLYVDITESKIKFHDVYFLWLREPNH